MLEEARIDTDVDDRRRRGRCCEIMFAWCYGVKDMSGWFRALWHLDDDRLRDICGTDYTLYLVFLRYTACLLVIICIFNAVVMIPLYVTGEPMDSDNYKLDEGMSRMNSATVLNITATHSKMLFSYFCAVIFIPLLGFYMIYRFRAKYYNWKKKVNPMDEFRDIDISHFAIEVRNLPIDEGVESL